MHYYQFNIKDYNADTKHLSLVEHGALRALLDQYYLDEKPLECDEEKLFRRLCVFDDYEQEIYRSVLNEFFIKRKSGWTHKRCDATIRLYKSNSIKSKKAAKARWGRESHADAMPTINQEPLTNKQEQKNTLSIEDESFLKTFETFWDKYPKKTDKEKAKKIWLKDKPNIDEVLKVLQWQKYSSEWEAENGRFIPYPSKYLLDQRWKDEEKIYKWPGR
jgi:uncharacterized protein YdaU (DUF1376 family)